MFDSLRIRQKMLNNSNAGNLNGKYLIIYLRDAKCDATITIVEKYSTKTGLQTLAGFE